MSVLVTGGAGFIGRHLVTRLLSEGNRVYVVDDFSTGVRGLLPSHSRLTVLEADVIEPLSIPARVDRIFHLACPASPPHYQADPVRTFRTGVWGTFNVLELARATKARVLLASTSEVYGDPHQHPQRESYWGHVNPWGVRSCYDEGKRGGETLAHDFRLQYEVDVRVARIFNTYGPGMRLDDGRVISNFLYAAIHEEPLTIYGDGTQTRSFCYVDDLVSGLLALMEVPGAPEHPVNLGNPQEFTMNELAHQIDDLCGPQVRTHHRLPEDDPSQRRPDISLAQELLHWHPVVGLREGLGRTFDALRSTALSGPRRERSA
ncbi:UDP-glucuronic acid decarboxylase family protein [Luteipulveratus mongoliensis]|uniref:NAD-dependent dehydratase n=1 Tax=Luteipulveratus mongoliensis TaxID=571913 RepID=A0A0K1JDX2_9MICO|nr:UDP-glucuronic acid decarboxylase family protein [Luteipulveratus mongoliensis]AKU14904.1 NAD-dependent dehydratase [Luteipulveratus mongoliensis]